MKHFLNYQHLLYFRAIATEGGVAKAAAKLKLGQSTLSTQLAQLEEHIGIQLFERRQRRLHLTDAGRVALEYAREIFELGDELLDALHDRRDAGRLRIQIGALDSVPKAIVAQLVETAQSTQPCTISVSEGPAGELLRALRSHEVDLVLFNHQPTERNGIKARLVTRDPVVVLGASRFAHLKRDFPASLAGHPFVMPGLRSLLRHDLDQFFRARGIAIDVVLDAEDSGLLTLLASQGRGLIAIGAKAARNLGASLRLKCLGTLDDVYDELWLVAGERRIENPIAARLFRNFT